MSVDEMISKARDEIRKATQPQPDIETMISNTVPFVDNVLKRLIAHTLARDIDSIFDSYYPTVGVIELESPNSRNDKYSLSLDIVPRDYILDLGPFKDHPEVNNCVSFLLNAVAVLYAPLSDVTSMRIGNTFNYKINISSNSTIFLDESSDKRIGVVLKKII